MTLLFIRAETAENASDVVIREALEQLGGYDLSTSKPASEVTDADVLASTGVVVATYADTALLAALPSLGGAGGPDRPLVTYNRSNAWVSHVGLTSGTGLAAVGFQNVYVTDAGVAPLNAGSTGLRQMFTASAELQYIRGPFAAGLAVYTTENLSLPDRVMHARVPQGGTLSGTKGAAQHPVAFALPLLLADVGKVATLFREFAWRTAFQALGDPASHGAAAGVTISVGITSGNRITVPGRAVPLLAEASSSDGSAVTVAWTATGAAGSFSVATALATAWTPPAGSGTYTLKVTATGTGGVKAEATITVTVLPGAQTLAPIASSVSVGATVTGAATAHEALADSSDESYVALTAVGHKVAHRLTSILDPLSSTGYGFWVGLLFASGATAATVTVELVESTGTADAVRDGAGTVRATRTGVTLNAKATDSLLQLTAQEADSVADHAALWQRVTVATLVA